ncbi:ABC transporter ATP-binding protein [Clostridium cellulovorans]|uniref:ABC transporter related n=1 Tax=Clostridium cellulovorans (strain ATCC 35296 / DSM 3052 / OCM 3 / 743B) TaxID=573061 RepID=D9SQG4_CLOC7|nr:ATP-binding cassette domain-containing protein [Clostridium cellulovorans]ADL50231.1 ABC transporter related [Clostridium cellulovorans 743B]
MIHLEEVSREFKSYKKEPGFKGAVKALFSKETVVKTAVDKVSFHIAEGEMVGYIGANGAGKSTTIKIMTGILVPTSGKCTVAGVVPYENRQKNAEKIGVVFGQRTQLWWDLPLTETYSILKEIYNVSDEDFKERMEFLNKVLDLDEFINSAVRTLSLGQRMRADLAASLLHNPKVLFLDEPTIGLDVVVKENMRKAIKEINQKYKTTVILTTHDLTDIEELCDRIIIIDKGKKIYDGSIEKIKREYGNKRILEMYVKNIKETSEIDVAKEFKLSAEECKTWTNDNSILVEFDKNKINMPEIVAYVMSKVQIVDMKIKETDIEDIVKMIYGHEVKL